MRGDNALKQMASTTHKAPTPHVFLYVFTAQVPLPASNRHNIAVVLIGSSFP
jgi:hypothetical protein